MSFNRIYDIAASGLAAQRLRVQLVATNIANSETTRTPEGGPFRKKEAIFEPFTLARAKGGNDYVGVRVKEVKASSEPFTLKYEPGHPDADAEGIVRYPNVNPMEEMVNLTEASRAYEGNVAVIRAARTMSQSALDLLRVQ